MQNFNVPSYYEDFKCIGTACEDTCCKGWKISIDRDTYEKYEASEDSILKPIFSIAIDRNTATNADNANNFGIMKMLPNGDCHFLQEDKLCGIQKHMGPDALSVTCSVYPRMYNRFGSQREIAIGVSCPEAARVVLLNRESITFKTINTPLLTDSSRITSWAFPLGGHGDPAQIDVLNDFRALIIAILQMREISVGARLMVLGFLLEDIQQIANSASFSNANEMMPVLSAFFGMLSQPAELEKQYENIQPDIPRKLEIVTKLIPQLLTSGTNKRLNECLLDASEGLSAEEGEGLIEKYTHSRENYYAPFFKDRGHIFENYMVNHVISRLFPFTRGSYLDLYRELVFNICIIQVLLVGMSARNKGLDESIVVKLIQTFSRKADHNRSHLDSLAALFGSDPQSSFFDVMWMVKEIG